MVNAFSVDGIFPPFRANCRVNTKCDNSATFTCVGAERDSCKLLSPEAFFPANVRQAERKRVDGGE